jgi:hypothetical protein
MTFSEMSGFCKHSNIDISLKRDVFTGVFNTYPIMR